MFKALFVPQGFLTLALIALIGYRHWTGDWPDVSALIAQQESRQPLSWDRQLDRVLTEAQLRELKREILDQIDQMEIRRESRQR